MKAAIQPRDSNRFRSLAVGVFGLLVLAAVSPLRDPSWRSWFTPLLCLWLVITLVRRRHHAEPAAARRFWNDLIVASTSVLAVLLTMLLTSGRTTGAWSALITDFLFVGYYFGLVLAVERKPERRRPSFDPDTGRWTWPAVTVFVLGAFAYFIALPALEQTAQADHHSTQLLFAALDGYLVTRLVHRAIRAQGRWRRVYVLLTVTTASTLLYALLRLFERADGALEAFVWFAPVAAFLLVAHERGQPELLRPRPADPSFWPRSGDQAVLLALTAPMIHFMLHQWPAMAPEALKPARELLVLFWTLALGAIALLQRRALERKSWRMLVERERLSERLGDAAADLRMIVENRSAAQALSVTESKLERALEVCPDAIGISTVADGRFVEINPAFEALTGYQRHEILGQTSSELEIWFDPAHRMRIVETVRRHGHARDIELPVRIRSGGQRTVVFSAQPVDIGGDACLIIVGRDVSELRALEATRALHARLLHSVREAVYAIDGEGHIQFWNRGAERLYRWNAEEAREHDAASLLFPYDPAPLTVAHRSAVERGHWHGSLSPATRTGMTLEVVSRWTRLTEPAADPPWLLIVDTDAALLGALEDQPPR